MIEVTAAELLAPADENALVERWRAEELERAGFDPRAAATIAARHDIDLHLATSLMRRGCAQELALQILL
jgi:hypothetical protein